MEQATLNMAMSLTNKFLEKPSLRDVNRYIKSFACEEWHDLGLELGVGDSDGEFLDQIKQNNHNNKRDCFTDMIKAWIKADNNVTWQALLDGLRELGIEEAVRNVESFLHSGSANNQLSNSQEPSQHSNLRSDDLQETRLGHHSTNTVQMIPASIDAPDSDDDLPDDNPVQPYEAAPSPLERQPVGCELVRTPRGYQQELAQPGIEGKNYIFIAPTGSGKTMVAEMIIQAHINRMREQNIRPRVVFMTKTIPLAGQQAESLKKNLRGTTVECIAGPCISTIHMAFSENEIVACTSGKLEEELKSGKLLFDLEAGDRSEEKVKLTLIVMDECHNAGKPSLESRVMERYLEFKHSKPDANMPQVVGLTASPGAGENPTIDRDIAIEHLKRLCAILDAQHGMVTVTNKDNFQELNKHSVRPDYTTVRATGRDPTESFLVRVRDEMNELEKTTQHFNNCPHPKWSPQYESTAVRIKTPLECVEHSRNRDEVSTINLLICYSKALSLYMELRKKDALKVMEEFHDLPQDDSHCTPRELELKKRLNALIPKLKMLKEVENPLLVSTKQVITERFEENPDSRAMIFVHFKQHAYGIRDFLKSIRLNRTTLRPVVITGHTKDTKSTVKTAGMTPTDQKGVLEKFRTGECNVLVATKVAEEGLDIPACNLVIPYQRATTDIGQAQTEGRARAERSEIVSIISRPGIQLREIQNLAKLELIKEIIRNHWIPTGRFLQLKEKQVIILEERKARKRYRARLQDMPRDRYTLICKKCKVLVCYGIDVYKEKQTPGDDEHSPNCHYVVVGEDIATRCDKKPHHSPGDVNREIYKTHKIHCKKCGSSWGVWCTFYKYHLELPMLKCNTVLFKEGRGPPVPVKKWSEVPFAGDALYLEDWVAGQVRSDDEGED